MWNHLMTIHRETGLTLEHINLGGGIPVNYLRDRSQADQLPEHEREMLGADLEPSAVLTEALRVAREAARDAEAEHLLENVTILLEPGRSIIADTGVVLTRVQNIKRRPETDDVWLLTDAGYNLLLSMNNYKWYYHLISASRACEPVDGNTKSPALCAIRATCILTSSATGRLPDYRFAAARRETGRGFGAVEFRRLFARANVSVQRSTAAGRSDGAVRWQS
jgi:diaminopimelate decarboxylase